MNNDFVYIEKYGQLRIDKIFFEADYPILFTCINSSNELFICVCCQSNRNGRKWLLSTTNTSSIIKLLENRIPMRQIFIENPDCRITISEYNGTVNIIFDNEADWADNSIFLPKQGEFLNPDPQEFDEEIRYYREKANISRSALIYDIEITNAKSVKIIFEEDMESKVAAMQKRLLAYQIALQTLRENKVEGETIREDLQMEVLRFDLGLIDAA